jgi:hypothetical protein
MTLEQTNLCCLFCPDNDSLISFNQITLSFLASTFSVTHIVDASQLGESATWAATTQTSGVFNIANGDPIRWCNIWPHLAEYFGLQCGIPRPIPLAESMIDQKNAWVEIARREKLVSMDVEKLVNWSFLEFVFSIEYDIVLALNKIRQAGFVNHFDTLEGFKRRFQQYRGAGILPKFQQFQNKEEAYASTRSV